MRRLLIILTAALLLVPGSASSAPVDDFGYCSLMSGDDSIAACSRVIANGGKHLRQAYYFRGYTYGDQKGDFDHALADFNEAIRLCGTCADLESLYHTRGDVYRAKGDLDRALADYNEGININPDAGYIYDDRIQVYQAKGDYDHALADLSEVIRFDPKVVRYCARGDFYRDRKDFDHALADYDEALRLEPNNADTYNGRGNVYKDKGDLDHAIADYNEGIRLDPKAGTIYDNRGLAYQAKGDPDHALSDFNEAIRLDGAPAYAYDDRGNLYRDKGDFDHAIADYNEAIRLEPKSVDPYNDRGRAYQGKGDLDRARTDYSEAIGLDPKNAKAYAGRGMTYRRMGDIQHAKADLEQALKLDASLADARSALASLAVTPGSQAASTPAASDKPPANVVAAPIGRRVALVLGNAAYQSMPSLTNPNNDAADVDTALKAMGFQTILATDLNKAAMDSALGRFARMVPGSDVAVIYYSGHGMQFEGRNYLLPVDASLQSSDDVNRFELLAVDDLIDVLSSSTGLQLIVLDACRNNAVESSFKNKVASVPGGNRSVAATRGFARIEARGGLIVTYSTAPDQVASDGSGRNSPFTAAFLKNVVTPDIEVRQMLFRVQSDVYSTTQHQQIPEISSLYAGPEVRLRISVAK